MIKQFLQKYILEVIPSIFATVIGAYIVTHYINAKPDPDKDKPAAAVSAPATPAKLTDAPKGDDAQKLKAEAAAKAAAEKLAAEKAAAERAATEKAEAARKATEKLASEKAAAEKLAAEKAVAEKLAAEKREREKTVAKTAPVAVEASATPDDRPDANDLARAAIERLRAQQPKTESTKAEPPKAADPARDAVMLAPPVQYAPPPAPTSPREAAISPIPSPVMQPNPPVAIDQLPTATISEAPVAQANTHQINANRPVPPADIPSQPPLDLTANTKGDGSASPDVFSAAKSAFQAVLPH